MATTRELPVVLAGDLHRHEGEDVAVHLQVGRADGGDAVLPRQEADELVVGDGALAHEDAPQALATRALVGERPLELRGGDQPVPGEQVAEAADAAGPRPQHGRRLRGGGRRRPVVPGERGQARLHRRELVGLPQRGVGGGEAVEGAGVLGVDLEHHLVDARALLDLLAAGHGIDRRRRGRGVAGRARHGPGRGRPRRRRRGGR
jgi:hypothetical protein